jgi:hypothetical protein
MSDLSASARALLRCARSDGPSEAARERIWAGVASATGTLGAAGALAKSAGPSAAGAPSVAGGGAASGASLAASKLVAFGALLGSAITVGVASLVLGVGAPAAMPAEPLPRAGQAEIESIDLASKSHAEAFSPPHVAAASSASSAGSAGGSAGAPAANASAGDDPLLLEAKLLAEARGAVRRGDPLRALAAVDAARKTGRSQLEPEAMSIEIGALRALGRDDEAMRTELEMRRKYPDHALCR